MTSDNASGAKTIRWSGVLGILVMVMIAAATTAGLAHAETSSIERSESIDLFTGDWLRVFSNKESLQSVEITGNLSAVQLPSVSHYPAKSINMTSHAQGRYSVTLTFSLPSEYNVAVVVDQGNGTRRQIASYYFSSGKLILTIDLNFSAPDPAKVHSSSIGWGDFASWTSRFGAAFPFWVKLLYAVLAVQFVVVGYKWIRFENEARQEKSSLSRLDRGNLLYLWSDIIYKLLLTSFLAIAAVMSGQFILLSVLKFMFLAQVDMLNLWDLYVLGFAAGIVAIAYCFKFLLHKSFDLNPLFED